MLRYGRDYGRWNSQGRYDWERPGGYGHGIGGPQNDSWGAPRGNLPGEGPWMGDTPGGNFGSRYDLDSMAFEGGQQGGYGSDYYGGRGGYGGTGWPGQGGGQFGGRDAGYGGGYGGGGYEGGMGYGRHSGRGGYGGYESGMEDVGERGGRRSGGESMRAADIMTEQPEAVSPEATLAEVAQKMRDLDVGIIPVVDSEQNRRLRGVITDRDITIRATAEGKDARSTKVSEVMTTDVETVNKNDRVRSVLEVMQRERVKRVPVTDREGRLVGIIAEADLLLEYEGREEERMVEDTLERVYEPSRTVRGGAPGRGGGGQGNRTSRPAEEEATGGSRGSSGARASNTGTTGSRTGAQRKGAQDTQE